MKKKIIILIGIFCISYSMCATNYYVSSSTGNDKNDGLSPSSPWKTLTKVEKESMNFLPGDKISLKRGDTWFKERLLLIGVKGRSGQPIVFTSYDTGSKPKINLLQKVNPKWTDLGSNIWKTGDLNDNPNRVYLDGREVLRTIHFPELGARVPDQVTWFRGKHNSGSVKDFYLYSIDHPSTRTLELNILPFCIYTSDCHYLEFNNLELIGGTKANIVISSSSNINLRDIHMGESAKQGIQLSTTKLGGNNYILNDKILIENCLIDSKYTLDYSDSGTEDWAEQRSANSGIYIEGTIDSEIKDCYIKNYTHGSIDITAPIGKDGNSKVNGIEIARIKIHNNILTSPDVAYGGRMGISGYVHDIEFFNNTIINTSIRSQFNGFNNHFHHNIIMGTKSPKIKSNSRGQGLTLEGYNGNVKGNIIENNIFINTQGEGIATYSAVSLGYYSVENNIIRNNIIFNCGSTNKNYGLLVNAKESNTYQNNLIYNSNTKNTIRYYNKVLNVDAFNGVIKDEYNNEISDNFGEDPLFINSKENWHLKPESPAINKGIKPLSTKDYDGNTIPNDGTLPDIGVYEYYENTTGYINANAGLDQYTCQGESVTLTASGGTTYSWSNGATTKSITVNPTQTTTYTVTVSDGSASDTDDVVVTVNNVAAKAGDQTITEGESVTLTAIGGDSYVWSTGETTKSIVVSPSSTTSYTVTAKKGDCEDTDTVKVTVNPPATKITANAGSDEVICLGENVTLTASGGTTYSWSNGATTKNITVNPTDTTTYTVTVSEGGSSDTDDVAVTVNIVDAGAGGDTTITEGESITLTARGGDGYVWNTGETTESIVVSPTSTMIYSVTAKKGDCEDTDSVEVTVNKNVVANPIPASANAGEDVTICLGESVTLNATGGDSYIWSSGDTNKTIDVSPMRTTTYTLNATRGYTTDTDAIVVTVENCNEREEEGKVVFEKLLIYPNPTKGDLNIQLNSLGNEDVNLVVISMNGSVVYQEKMQSNINGVTKNIDLSRFSKGMYFVNVFNKHNNLIEKILFQ